MSHSDNPTRCFAFGCSLTQYSYATWADYIGANFDEYYNYGRSGSSNTFMMNRVIEVDDKFNFNPETDYVLVMVTGFGRFSYLTEGWQTHGDLYGYYQATKDKSVEWFTNNMWSERWAVYQSWIAIKTIRDLLTTKGVPFKIVTGIDNSHYMKETATKWGHTHVISPNTIQKVQDIYNLVDDTESYDMWLYHRYKDTDYPRWKDGRFEGHPSQKMHYDYLKDKFSEFDTDKARLVFDKTESIFLSDSQSIQEHNFRSNFYNNYNKANNYPLFGDAP
jgi:hypothetical protein